jgi:hypothetical protein
MSKYRVTIHEHVISDLVVEADSKQAAVDIAEEHITEGYNGWVVDEMAGWIEVGDVYNEDGEEI